MKRPLSIFVLVIALTCFTSGQEPAPKPEKLEALIEDVNSPYMTDLFHREIKDETQRPDVREHARSKLEKAKESIPKLRKLIRIGSSIFDYPGLMSRGYLHYNRIGTKGTYSLKISATFIGREAAVLPYEFRLEFDDRGIITKVDDIRYKK
jgi:hypothetical protein